jgi:hypothetical protein
MVINSFTNIPVKMTSGKWKLISDSKIAMYRSMAGRNRGEAMFCSIGDAFPCAGGDTDQLPDAMSIEATAPLCEIWPLIGGGLIIVEEKGRLMGVVSAFDLL